LSILVLFCPKLFFCEFCSKNYNNSMNKPKSWLTKTEKVKKVLKATGIAGALAFAVLKWPSVYQHMKQKDDIKTWRLEYTEKGWWVDRGHANPNWAKWLWQDINNPQPLAWNESYGIVHYQQVQAKFWIHDAIGKTYIIKTWTTKEEKESIALTIFLDVSRQFEWHQKTTDRLTGSSYSQEDLFSNMIWFYRAVRGYSLPDIKKTLHPIGADASSKMYDLHGIGKNETIGKIIKYQTQEQEDSANIEICKYPYPFNQIKTIRKWKFYGKKGILLREYKERWQTEELMFAWYTKTWLEKFMVLPWFPKKPSSQNVKTRLAKIDENDYKKSKYLISREQWHTYITLYR